VLADLWPYYEEGEKGRRELLSDMLELANHPYYNWGVTFSPDELIESHSPVSFLDCFSTVYRGYTQVVGAEWMVFKENHLFNYAFPLQNYFEGGKFIYLYRDARDCAASWMNVPMGYSTPLQAARVWSREQKACIQLRDVYNLDLVSVDYESLIEQPEVTMRRVLNHIGVKIESACFKTVGKQKKNGNSEKEKIEYEYWKNLKKPIMSSNQKKYKKEFSKEDICKIETVACEEMLYLGYKLETNADWQRPKRRLPERLKGLSRRVLDKLRKKIGVNYSVHEEKENEDKTSKTIKSMLSLRRKIKSTRKQEWRRRKSSELS